MGVERRKGHRASKVRRFRLNDADDLMSIMAESPEAAGWSKDSYLKLLEEDELLPLVVETGGELRGFLVARQIGDQAEVLNLAVSGKHRRKGEATALLTTALKEIRSRGAKTVYLEVRESNTGAIAFYGRHGFAKTGRRKSYYRSPDEAAITMEKVFTG